METELDTVMDLFLAMHDNWAYRATNSLTTLYVQQSFFVDSLERFLSNTIMSVGGFKQQYYVISEV